MYLPETSIVVTLNDRYSETAKKLSQVTKAFIKDAEGLEQRLYALNKNKYTLKLDAQKARQELKEAEKQFAATGKEADGLKMELAQANYDNIVRNLKAVTTAAGDTEKAISKTMNRAGSSKGAVGIVDAIAQAGIANMASNVALNASNAIFSSVLGEAGGNVFSSGLSMAITGAAMGSIIPGIGTAAGAVLGGIAGMASGAIQNWERKDDAFKSYVQDAYEGQMSAQEASLTSGSALAAQRETDRISFETLFRRGGPGAEHRRHGGHGHGHRADEVQQQGHTGVSEYPERPGHRRGGDAGGGQGCRPGRHVRHDLQGAGVRPGGTAESGMT